VVVHFVNIGGIVRPSLFKLSLHKNALPFHAYDTFNNSLQCIFSFPLCLVRGWSSTFNYAIRPIMTEVDGSNPTNEKV
jgi:hypothetical protein